MSDNENTIHNEPDNDSHSQSSTVSAGKQVRECPTCKKEIQTRSLFNHTFKNHKYMLLCSMAVWDNDTTNEYIASGNAFPFSYSVKNDFDEYEEHKIYGCLSCNNTYTQEGKANAHCQNTKCKAKHIKGIKALIKEDKATKKIKTKIPKSKTLSELRDIIQLEMRRYKHICEVSYELNELLHSLLLTGTETGLEFNKAVLITLFDEIDYRIDPSVGTEGLEKLQRIWGRRTDAIENEFIKLRDHLYHYSYAKVDRFKPMCAEFPDRIYVGLNHHDELGASMYPPL